MKSSQGCQILVRRNNPKSKRQNQKSKDEDPQGESAGLADNKVAGFENNKRRKGHKYKSCPIGILWDNPVK